MLQCAVTLILHAALLFQSFRLIGSTSSSYTHQPTAYCRNGRSWSYTSGGMPLLRHHCQRALDRFDRAVDAYSVEELLFFDIMTSGSPQSTPVGSSPVQARANDTIVSDHRLTPFLLPHRYTYGTCTVAVIMRKWFSEHGIT